MVPRFEFRAFVFVKPVSTASARPSAQGMLLYFTNKLFLSHQNRHTSPNITILLVLVTWKPEANLTLDGPGHRHQLFLDYPIPQGTTSHIISQFQCKNQPVGPLFKKAEKSDIKLKIQNFPLFLSFSFYLR
jgi:hypothetical protein